jgi:DNA-binding transcriptional regulator YbjK
MTYYEISERTARDAHYMMSMRDYQEGSATAEYRSSVDAAAALVESKKAEVSPYYYDKLDKLLDTYARRLAKWTNDYNQNGASCPSVLVCGPANFPTRKKQRQNARESALWEEYRDIKGILDMIQSVGTGPVDLADPHAREMLTEQLETAQKVLETYKAVNSYWRKNKTATGCPAISEHAAEEINAIMADTKSFSCIYGNPYPDYKLTSARGKIKRLQERLEELDRLEAARRNPEENVKFDGGEIVRNAEENRLQILFDEIPDAEIRQSLKSHGFRWSPRNKAWQRQLTKNAEYDAKSILGIA